MANPLEVRLWKAIHQPGERLGTLQDMPVTQFKHVRQVNGRGQYASVQVLVERDREHVSVGLADTVEIRGNDDRLRGEDPDASEWVQGALRGCREAMDYAQTEGLCGAGEVWVLRIDGAYVDTSMESVRIAAFMATWEGLTGGQKPLALTFEHDRWQVQRR